MSGPIRLLLFQNSTVRAGVEEVVLSLANGLGGRGFDVRLAAPQKLLDALGDDLHLPAEKRFPIHISSFKQWSEIRRLAAYLREERIDVVNSHLFYATLFAAPVAKLSGVPVVVETTHGPEAWRTGWLKRRYWVDRLVELFVTKNLAVSEANGRYLREQKRYPERKVCVVPNGRDLQACRAAQTEIESVRRLWGLQQESRVLVCPGRLETQKGHCYLIDAMPEVVKRFPAVKLLLVGEGSLRASLERQVLDRGVGGHILFAGYQTGIAAYYGASEMVVLPSLYEGMPLVAIEAAGAGRPLVASRVDGTCEVVVDGQTGLLTEPRDPVSLAAAMIRLLEDVDLSRKMGRAAQQRADELFTIDRQLDLTAKLIRDTLAGNGRAS